MSDLSVEKRPSPRRGMLASISLRRKLISALLGITVLFIAVAAGGFALSTWRAIEQHLVREAYTIARIIGETSTASLAFNSEEDAIETLSALRAQPSIRAAYLFTEEGKLLAKYLRNAELAQTLPSAPIREGHYLIGGVLHLNHLIDVDGRRFGSVVLQSSTGELYGLLFEQMYVVLVLLMVALAAALFLSGLFQRLIIRPIEALVLAARQVSLENDYSVRAEKLSHDELGILADSFNDMLNQVQRKTIDLETTQEILKERVVDLAQEIKQRRQVESELRDQKQQLEVLNTKLGLSNKELDAFAYVASHDLQEPLRKIQTFGDRLESICKDRLPEKGKEYLMHMLDSASRMRALINDLLSLSRVTTQGEPFTQVDLNKVLEKVLFDLSVSIEELGADVTFDYLPTVSGDPMQLYRLFQNLIGNSLKYHRVGVAPMIHVSCIKSLAPGVDSVELLLEDNGIGFDPKFESLIFRPFQRLHGRDEYGGTGIGLAVCAKIVERHQGIITASGVPGKGAVFSVTLPIEQPTEERSNAEESIDYHIGS